MKQYWDNLADVDPNPEELLKDVDPRYHTSLEFTLVRAKSKKKELKSKSGYITRSKLKILKANVKSWNKSCRGNVHLMVSMAEENLEQINLKIHSEGYSERLRKQERDCLCCLEEARHKENIFWQEKAKVK
ncbi:hypothetical protein KIW84_030673 [Lathyrus oleraceus]|uniref:Uncharacterized protein n=1 Tax=Pisum sativum TaxID=3888 RepID=A0A9D4XPZ5_PEA|nr:hypothetical protein KIW84_030673 [Pisum sativum]